MCDILNSNFLSKMLFYGSSCVVAAMMIVMTIYIVNFLFLILKLFSLHIPKILFEIMHDIVVEVFQMKNNNNEILNDDSDNSTYETAEEETSHDFQDSHQYVSLELPPEALDFYPMSSLIALRGVPTQDQVTGCHESTEAFQQPLLNEIQGEWIDVPLRSDSSSSLEAIQQQVIDCRESKVKYVESLLTEFPSEWVDVPVRDDSSSLIEPTEERIAERSESKQTLKQRLFQGISRKRASLPLRDNSNTSSESTDRRESKNTWKLRLLCCMSSKTDD